MSAPLYCAGDIVVRKSRPDVRMQIIKRIDSHVGREHVYAVRLDSMPEDDRGFLLWETDLASTA